MKRLSNRPNALGTHNFPQLRFLLNASNHPHRCTTMVGCLLVSLDFFSVCLLYPLMKLRIISESETMKPLGKYNKFTHCCVVCGCGECVVCFQNTWTRACSTACWYRVWSNWFSIRKTRVFQPNGRKTLIEQNISIPLLIRNSKIYWCGESVTCVFGYSETHTQFETDEWWNCSE